jgi:hypothetical protein
MSLKEMTGQSFGQYPTDAAPALALNNEWRLWWAAHKEKFVMRELKFLFRGFSKGGTKDADR